MAEHAAPEYATATGNDYAEHDKTYHNVMKLTKVATGAVVVGMVSLATYAISGKMWLTTLGLTGQSRSNRNPA